jgi:hypothetical protein
MLIMSDTIQYLLQEYYQLEGIPPYPSYFTPIDFSYRQWRAMNDAQRFRFEKTYSTRTSPSSSGLVQGAVGTGTGGVIKEWQFYEDQIHSTEISASPDVVTYESWLSGLASMGENFLQNVGTGKLADFQSRGIESDAQWGEIYVFEGRKPLEGSDLYPSDSQTTTTDIFKFDTQLLRHVEWRRTVNDSATTLYSLYRLVEWKVLDSEEVPSDLFVPILR